MCWSLQFRFLVATKRLYKSVCPAIRRSVGPSVRPSVHLSVCNAFAFRPSRSNICRVYGILVEKDDSSRRILPFKLDARAIWKWRRRKRGSWPWLADTRTDCWFLTLDRCAEERQLFSPCHTFPRVYRKGTCGSGVWWKELYNVDCDHGRRRRAGRAGQGRPWASDLKNRPWASDLNPAKTNKKNTKKRK